MSTQHAIAPGRLSQRLFAFHGQQRHTEPADERFLTGKDILERYGKQSSNRMFLKRLLEEKGFPQPYYFGGKSSFPQWKLSEISAWENQAR